MSKVNSRLQALLTMSLAIALAIVSLVGVSNAWATPRIWPGASGYVTLYTMPQPYKTANSSDHYTLRPYVAGSGGKKDHPAYCIQAGNWAPDPGETVTISTLGDPTHYGPSEVLLTNAQMAYLLNKYDLSSNGRTQSALVYLAHANYEMPSFTYPGMPDGPGRVNDMTVAIKSEHPDFWNYIVSLASEAKNSAAKGYETGLPTGENRREGTIQNIGVKNEADELVSGVPIKITLNGPAIFTDTGTNVWEGTSASSPLTLKWESTANGTVSTKFEYPGANVSRVVGPAGKQDMLQHGSGDPVVKDGPTWRVIYDFQPKLTSKVQTKVIDDPKELTDTLKVFADPES